MGSMTMDAFINIFLDLLHYLPYIKDKKIKIQQFLRCLPPNFRERIEFDMPKTFDTTLHKARLCYEHGKLRQENIVDVFVTSECIHLYISYIVFD